MGNILFIMHTANFAFEKASTKTGSAYKTLVKNPKKAMEVMGLSDLNPDFVELVHWMVQPKPQDRPTIEQIVSHKWMQGEMATAEEIRSHYYSLVPENQSTIDKEHYKAM